MAVTKRDDNDAQRTGIQVTDVHTILGPESKFQGTLSFEGTVRIDGHFKGDINTNDVLVVGQGARVEAEVRVGSIVINGEVVGNIYAKNAVEIHAPGRVRGNIASPVLVIDRGVLFEGSAKMENLGDSVTFARVTEASRDLPKAAEA